MIGPRPGDLFGRWNLDQMPDVDGSLATPLAGSLIVAEFDSAGSVAGNAGCNVYRGVFEVRGSSITIGRLATTQRLCLRPMGVMEQEARFLAALDRVARFSITGEALDLFDDSSELLITMRREHSLPA